MQLITLKEIVTKKLNVEQLSVTDDFNFFLFLLYNVKERKIKNY